MPTFLPSIVYGAYAIGIIVILVQALWLHEPEPHTARWKARTVVNVAGLIVLLVGIVGYAVSQQAQAVMARTVNAQGEKIGTQGGTINAQGKTIEDLKREEGRAVSQLKAVVAASAASDADIAIAKKRIALLNRSDAALFKAMVGAIHTSKEAEAKAAFVIATVTTATANINARLAQAEEAAREAQVKAHVFHLSVATQAAIVAALRPTAGTAGITCSPGIEPACDDLIAAFKAAGWKVSALYGGSFWGGLDQQYPSADSELTIFCSKPAQAVAEKVAAALRSGGLSVSVVPNGGGSYGGFALGISFRFIR